MTWRVDRPSIASLSRFLAGHGWEVDRHTGDLCWLYPHAFGGQPIQPDEAVPACESLAELGPLRPAVYVSDADIVVFSHGTWRGCTLHRERRYTFRRGVAGTMADLSATIARVERDSSNADPAPFRRCVMSGPCGEWFREWQRKGASLSWHELG